MTWSTLPTYTNGTLTASQLMAIRDNINETAPAKASEAGGYFVATGTNAITQRVVRGNSITVTGTTTNTSYADLDTGGVGPSVVVGTGAAAIVFLTAEMVNTVNAGAVWATFDVGITSTYFAPQDTQAIMHENAVNSSCRTGVTSYVALTAGNNTFTMKYRVSSGTGSFDDRRFFVMPL